MIALPFAQEIGAAVSAAPTTANIFFIYWRNLNKLDTGL